MYRAQRGLAGIAQELDQQAVEDAAYAAEFYAPLRSRFPELYSVALAEQAEYSIEAWPDEPQKSVALLRGGDSCVFRRSKTPELRTDWCQPYRRASGTLFDRGPARRRSPISCCARYSEPNQPI